MSHFTNMKTCFQNLLYLEKALNRLGVEYKKQVADSNLETDNKNLVITEPNGYDITASWNGQEYELIIDIDYLKQPHSMQIIIDKIGQQYAGEVIVGESQKIGFQPVKYQQNTDGSNTLVLERWNSSK